MSVVVTLGLNGTRVPVTLDDEVLAAIAAALPESARPASASESPYMSIAETATYLRVPRQTIDDWLSAGKLQRHKAGSRTLLRRDELERYVSKRREQGEIDRDALGYSSSRSSAQGGAT